MKIFITILIMFFSFHINAGVYEDRYTSCILENTSERDRVILVKWIFILLSEHPSLKNDFSVNDEVKIAQDMAVADYMSYIIGEKCLRESQDVLKYEGEDAFLTAFGLLGEIAFEEIAGNEDVSKSFERYLQYIDPSFFDKLM